MACGSYSVTDLNCLCKVHKMQSRFRHQNPQGQLRPLTINHDQHLEVAIFLCFSSS
ncbi:hypothetical protein MGG_17691 [Pyricularia oryzae 70-15]|uniref:Uncharacterized protein n=1 Tax=Pyricularia oryzae (strain 70-15 / ATCC MYA-4617 / FGSC 8958) TaxID=242507 RepID=G4NGL2_PYRO7|nr:uncharacterized protein MGG_17691 [Pyricularia oryzae 70-15]EHA47372.1 hypothetical protein MGG_17691 [Pyricularia oryzae 70-15]